MLNSKKLSMSYKKYRKNFVNESFIEHGKTEYERCISKIVDIVESNNVDRDHVLLINLGTIYDNYLMTWKEEVLVQNTNRIEGLKLMYPTVFYQCISQELYRIRYPNSTVDYTFKEIISTLIHFTMFGWQKEEEFFLILLLHIYQIVLFHLMIGTSTRGFCWSYTYSIEIKLF